MRTPDCVLFASDVPKGDIWKRAPTQRSCQSGDCTALKVFPGRWEDFSGISKVPTAFPFRNFFKSLQRIERITDSTRECHYDKEFAVLFERPGKTFVSDLLSWSRPKSRTISNRTG